MAATFRQVDWAPIRNIRRSVASIGVSTTNTRALARRATSAVIADTTANAYVNQTQSMRRYA